MEVPKILSFQVQAIIIIIILKKIQLFHSGMSIILIHLHDW